MLNRINLGDIAILAFIGACVVSTNRPILGQTTESNLSGEIDRAPWSLQVVHPSMNEDSLYYCTLRMPESFSIEDGSVVLLLMDRKNQKLGEVGVSDVTTHREERLFPFFLNSELVKNSYIQFLANPGIETGEIIKAYPGKQLAMRKVGGKIVREPID